MKKSILIVLVLLLLLTACQVVPEDDQSLASTPSSSSSIAPLPTILSNMPKHLMEYIFCIAPLPLPMGEVSAE